MTRLVKWIKKEIGSVFPAVLYFFFAISLFKVTFGWMLEARGETLITFSRIIISSIIIGKVMLVADVMPFLNRFSNKPLIYNTVWKTAIYSLFGFLFMLMEHFIPGLLKHHNLSAAWQYTLSDTTWPRFWTAHIWLVILFLVFVVCREFIVALGEDKVRKMFFGQRR